MSPEPRPRWLDPPPFTPKLFLLCVLLSGMLTITVVAHFAEKKEQERIENAARLIDLVPRPWVLGPKKERGTIISFSKSYDGCMYEKDRFVQRVPEKRRDRYMIWLECYYAPELWKERNLPQ